MTNPLSQQLPPFRRQAGFTIVEMMVVLAIVSILLAMLMPALKNAKRAAKRATCVNNVRQVGAALHVYAVDNNDELPCPFYFTYTRGQWAQLSTGSIGIGRLYPNYVDDPGVFYCTEYMLEQGPYISNTTYMRMLKPNVASAYAKTNLGLGNVSAVTNTIYTSIGLFGRYGEGSPPGALNGNVAVKYDVAHATPNDGVRIIGGLLNNNILIASGKTYPLAGCIQMWASGDMGCHDGNYSPTVYPDGHVQAIQYDWRGNNEDIGTNLTAWNLLNKPR